MYKNNMCQMEDVKFILKFYPEIGAWNDYENILHFGCGKGMFTNYFLLRALPKEVSNVIGMDFNSNDVILAQQRYSHPKITFKTINNCNEQFTETFDRIFSIYYIDDFLSKRNIFEKFYKNFLTPTGDIVILLQTDHFFAHVIEELKDQSSCSKVNLRLFSDKQNLTRSLIDIGFTQIICKTFERYQIFPNKKIMIEELKSLNFEVTDDFINHFMSTRVAKEKIKYFGKRSTIIAVPYQMTFVYAKKLIKK
ncbi:PREDICTED: uncharacterized protein LOC108565153 [Nicrophorus vespilloides]|uniref:Uncharacterized protein LOC108565153 n=1 Tax=Nicrophorus vespilloides TaxID=110193 RepID=A0ABM1MZD6_NICVS|nr:PREDICTED: uncharacterized protein LOC108565153 [Nicrophorus vespilloides]